MLLRKWVNKEIHIQNLHLSNIKVPSQILGNLTYGCSSVLGSHYERPPCNISSHISCLENSSDHLNSHLDLKDQKTSCPSPRHCSIPWVGQLQDFFPDLDPDYGKKTKNQKFLGDQSSCCGPRSWLHIQHRHTWKQALGTEPSVGMGSHGAVQDGLLEIWLSHLQLSLDSSVHTWHCLELVSVLQKVQSKIWEEEGSKE